MKLKKIVAVLITTRIETAIGQVCEDSGRKFGMYNSTAETYDPVIGIAKTYCGNLAAD